MRTYFNVINALGFFLIFLAFVIPDLSAPWDTYYHEILMAWGIFFVFPWRGGLKIPFFLMIGSLIFIIVISSQILTHRIFNEDVILGGVFCIFFMMASIAGASDDNNFKKLCIIIVSAAIFNSIVAIFQWRKISLGLLMVESSGRAYGNFAQPNHLATFIMMGVVALYFLDKNRHTKFIVWPCAFLFSFVLVITESRTGILSFYTFFLLLCALFFLKREIKISYWIYFCAIFILILNTNLELVSKFLGGSVSRIGVGFDSNGRIEIWQEMVLGLMQHPWLGYGWLNLGAVHHEVGTISSSVGNFDHAHNLFLDILIWFGIPVGIVIIFLIIIFLLKIFIFVAFKEINKKLLSAIGISLVVLVHGLLEFPLAYLYFLLPMGFFLGVIEKEVLSVREVGGFYEKNIKTVSILSAALIIFISIDYAKIEEDYRAMRLENNFQTKNEFLHNYNAKAKILNHYQILIDTQKKEAQLDSYEYSEVMFRLTSRFPWMSTHGNYYLKLLEWNECEKAEKEKIIFNKMFEVNGKLYLESLMAQKKIVTDCAY